MADFEVVVLGHFWPKDWAVLPISAKVNARQVGWAQPLFDLMTGKEVDAAQLSLIAHRLSEYDLVIVESAGHAPDWCGPFAEYLRQIRSTGTKLAWWLFDTHVWADKESHFAPLFDGVYTMHPQFAKCPMRHLPACVTRSAEEVRRQTADKLTRVVFYAHNYNGVRHAFWAKVKERLLVATDDGDIPRQAYFQKLCESLVVFNASVAGDVNIRNFEAWAGNCQLVTERHEQLEAIVRDTPLEASTWFYERGNLDEALGAIGEAFWADPAHTSEYIIKHHLLAHRLAKIATEQLGL